VGPRTADPFTAGWAAGPGSAAKPAGPGTPAAAAAAAPGAAGQGRSAAASFAMALCSRASAARLLPANGSAVDAAASAVRRFAACSSRASACVRIERAAAPVPHITDRSGLHVSCQPPSAALRAAGRGARLVERLLAAHGAWLQRPGQHLGVAQLPLPQHGRAGVLQRVHLDWGALGRGCARAGPAGSCLSGPLNPGLP